MKSFRIPRLQEELKKLFNIAISQKLRDHTMDWVTITDVIIAKDLRYAKVFFSHYNNPLSHDVIRDQLVKSSGFLKKQIAGAHIMRTIPELTFYYDDSEDRAEKVDALLANIKDEYDDDDDYDPDIDLEDYIDDDDVYDIDEDEEIYNQFIEDEENENENEDKEDSDS